MPPCAVSFLPRDAERERRTTDPFIRCDCQRPEYWGSVTPSLSASGKPGLPRSISSCLKRNTPMELSSA
jgi:hypothetical protein